MGFWRRLTGVGRGGSQETPAPQSARGPITSWPAGDFVSLEAVGYLFEPTGRATVEVVGESNYQGTLERIAGGRTIDGPRNPDHQATLIPEPSNPYDRNAVRVFVGPPFVKIGYLSREDAVRYRPVIDRLAATGKLAASLASLKGGWDRGPRDRAMFGVTLHLGAPQDLIMELDKDLGPDPAA